MNSWSHTQSFEYGVSIFIGSPIEPTKAFQIPLEALPRVVFAYHFIY